METEGHGSTGRTQDELAELEELLYLLNRVSTQQLYYDLFQFMVDSKLFVRKDDESAINVERFFREKRPELEVREERAKLLTLMNDQKKIPAEVSESSVQDLDLLALAEAEEAREDAEALALAESKITKDPILPETPDG